MSIPVRGSGFSPFNKKPIDKERLQWIQNLYREYVSLMHRKGTAGFLKASYEKRGKMETPEVVFEDHDLRRLDAIKAELLNRALPDLIRLGEDVFKDD